MRIIIGLGNPDEKYQETRHNLGFWAVDLLAEKWQAEFAMKKKLKAMVAACQLGDKEILLIKPQTYMNLSGESVRCALQFYKIAPPELLVIYDDFDLPLGSVRFRENGGPGTHNGMRSIIEKIGTEDFPRLRLGTKPEKEVRDLSAYVLGNMTAKEKQIWQGNAEEMEKKIAEVL